MEPLILTKVKETKGTVRYDHPLPDDTTWCPAIYIKKGPQFQPPYPDRIRLSIETHERDGRKRTRNPESHRGPPA